MSVVSAPRRLVGVGVGPGDPELITVKAVATLARADVILVPTTERRSAGAGRAEEVVTAAVPGAADRLRRVPFSMADRSGVTPRRRAAWEASADAALAAFTEGASLVCFATVGDPSVYSTFSYLADHVTDAIRDVEVEVIPGIMALQALAAASRTPLVEGTEVLALVPVTAGLETFEGALDVADTVVAYKAGRHLPDVLDALERHGRLAHTVVGTDIGLPEENIVAAERADRSRAPYFSTVLTVPERTATGGRL